ncbi:PREDICTED: metabotropic glutamate receptor 3-like [Ceratosolen solmsi marchali]|uniref:Metabotropic glutamate receptor 3-like n=1 Tax=Ceratosolen solmsi marchali TaxID=326594 RepID=A0AAJ6YPJ8_9HYME|nr:PREDICTED: metabotropic glutamate receptor 3-like [Ceratosolen solmsi marchali]
MFLLYVLLISACKIVEAKVFVNISGDIILGALFPIHKKGLGTEKCGKIQMEDGIQPLEAMIYTVSEINRNPNILPGINLGVLAFDSCDNPHYALEQALHFIKGFIAHVNEYHKVEFQCLDGSVPKFLGGDFDKVVAVLAAQSSSVTLQVASILRLFSVPQISYMATSPSLSSKERFSHFFRTVPSDVNQAHAMLEILKQFEWTYVSIVYSDTEYGKHGYETLVSLANKYSVCFSAPQRIDKDRFLPEDYDNVIRTITNKTEVRVVVLFAEKVATLHVMEAARRLGVGRRFVWIGSDAWSSSNHSNNILDPSLRKTEEVVLEGALAVQPLSRQMPGFDNYFTGLNSSHEAVNPWFREFWTEYHRPNINACKTKTLDIEDGCFNEAIHKITRESGYKQQKYIHFVRDAVYSVAHALHDMFIDRCGKAYKGICKGMQHIDGESLIEYIANVSFKDVAGNKFRFMNSVDGPPRYSILNYQQDSNGLYRWLVVGNYTQNESGSPVLQLDQQLIKYRSQEISGRHFFPNSTCDSPCHISQVKVREKQDPCCWRCRYCGLYQYKLDDYRCEDCEWGKRPTDDKISCSSIPEEFIDYTSPWAVAAMAVATCGILLTIFVLCIFWLYSKTPIIKASGRELSSLLLLGTLISFLMTFAIIAKPNTQTCAITRFGIGLCYTLCYSALVTKTNRIHRIFNKVTNSPHKPRYTSPGSQLIITGILTLVEVIINGAWLLKAPPAATYIFPTRDTRLRICQGFNDRSYIIGLIYPFILIVICTVYAVKTRKCPEGFNETRHIAFTNYTTLILWMAFVPLYLASTSNAIRVVTLALSLSLSAFAQLACLFFPKVYIVLIKPQKNTKELVMAYHRSSSYVPTSATSTTPVVILNGNPLDCGGK